MAAKHWEQNKDATVYVGNLDERVSEGNLWELMIQMGPVFNVHMPMDRVSRTHQGYGFVEFDTADSADYASRVLNGIRLHQKPIRVNKASADKQRGLTDIGAELFVNNLDQQVDEKILYDTFAQFGGLVAAPNVVRDDNNVSKGYGFVSFDSFEASDVAQEAMNGQYLLSKQITVEYAYKKDGKGQRHGDESERRLAAEGKKHNVVAEAAQLPPAFLMSAPATGANGTPTSAMPPPHLTGANSVSTNGNNGIAPYGQSQGYPPQQSYGGAGLMGSSPQAPPSGFGGHSSTRLGLGAPPTPGNLPPGFGGRGGGAGGGGGGGASLPAAPQGLPARPPPPGFAGGVGGGAPPPPGFPGALPPGFGMAPPPAPNGFGPPPGFGAPPGGFGIPSGQLPPSNYARR